MLKINVPMNYLEVDPEDGTSETVEEEIETALKFNLPAYLVVVSAVPAKHFSIWNEMNEVRQKMAWRQKANEPYVKRQDLLDAIDHASEGEFDWTINDFDIKYLGMLSAEDLYYYDSLDWKDFEEEELVGLSKEEIHDELAGFRGEDWADMAMDWLDSGIPPIVVIEAPDPQEGDMNVRIGDGRGRTNFALALDMKLPVYYMEYMGINEIRMTVREIIRESVQDDPKDISFKFFRNDQGDTEGYAGAIAWGRQFE